MQGGWREAGKEGKRELGKEGGRGVGKKKKKMGGGKKEGEGDVRTQQRQQSHQVMDTLTDKQHSGRDRQTSRGCNAERAQTIPYCACVSVCAEREAGDKNVRACVCPFALARLLACVSVV